MDDVSYSLAICNTLVPLAGFNGDLPKTQTLQAAIPYSHYRRHILQL